MPLADPYIPDDERAASQARSVSDPEAGVGERLLRAAKVPFAHLDTALSPLGKTRPDPESVRAYPLPRIDYTQLSDDERKVWSARWQTLYSGDRWDEGFSDMPNDRRRLWEKIIKSDPAYTERRQQLLEQTGGNGEAAFLIALGEYKEERKKDAAVDLPSLSGEIAGQVAMQAAFTLLPQARLAAPLLKAGVPAATVARAAALETGADFGLVNLGKAAYGLAGTAARVAAAHPRVAGAVAGGFAAGVADDWEHPVAIALGAGVGGLLGPTAARVGSKIVVPMDAALARIGASESMQLLTMRKLYGGIAAEMPAQAAPPLASAALGGIWASMMDVNPLVGMALGELAPRAWNAAGQIPLRPGEVPFTEHLANAARAFARTEGTAAISGVTARTPLAAGLAGGTLGPALVGDEDSDWLGPAPLAAAAALGASAVGMIRESRQAQGLAAAFGYDAAGHLNWMGKTLAYVMPLADVRNMEKLAPVYSVVERQADVVRDVGEQFKLRLRDLYGPKYGDMAFDDAVAKHLLVTPSADADVQRVARGTMKLYEEMKDVLVAQGLLTEEQAVHGFFPGVLDTHQVRMAFKDNPRMLDMSWLRELMDGEKPGAVKPALPGRGILPALKDSDLPEVYKGDQAEFWRRVKAVEGGTVQDPEVERFIKQIGRPRLDAFEQLQKVGDVWGVRGTTVPRLVGYRSTGDLEETVFGFKVARRDLPEELLDAHLLERSGSHLPFVRGNIASFDAYVDRTTRKLFLEPLIRDTEYMNPITGEKELVPALLRNADLGVDAEAALGNDEHMKGVAKRLVLSRLGYRGVGDELIDDLAQSFFSKAPGGSRVAAQMLHDAIHVGALGSPRVGPVLGVAAEAMQPEGSQILRSMRGGGTRAVPPSGLVDLSKAVPGGAAATEWIENPIATRQPGRVAAVRGAAASTLRKAAEIPLLKDLPVGMPNVASPVRNVFQSMLMAAAQDPKDVTQGLLEVGRNYEGWRLRAEQAGALRNYADEIRQVMQLSEGTPLQLAWKRMIDTSLGMFSAVEEWLRTWNYATGEIAALRLGPKGVDLSIFRPDVQQNLRRAFDTLPLEQAAAMHGRELSDLTNFVYGKDGAPLVMQMPAGALGLTFMTWPANYISLLMHWSDAHMRKVVNLSLGAAILDRAAKEHLGIQRMTGFSPYGGRDEPKFGVPLPIPSGPIPDTLPPIPAAISAGLGIVTKAPQGEPMREESQTLRRALGLPFRPIGRTIDVAREDDPTKKVKLGLGFRPTE